MGNRYIIRAIVLIFVLSVCVQCRPTPPPAVSIPPTWTALPSSPTATPAAPTLVPTASAGSDANLAVTSPNGELEVVFMLERGAPRYAATFRGAPLLQPSRLGFIFQRDLPMMGGFDVKQNTQSTFDETWTQPWGEVKEIRNHYNELRVELVEATAPQRTMIVTFRVYDDGFGFRYEFPEQPGLGQVFIADELTEFVLADDHTAWWIPAYQPNRYEYLYHQTHVSDLLRESPPAAHTPYTMQTDDGLYLSIHEADLTDYAAMTLLYSDSLTLKCDLVPWSDGVKVKTATPFVTPWRTVQVADTPGGLITSYLILNLNDPNVLEDTSWIKPQKYIGIWWGMHIGVYSWESGPLHGATTANASRYIDFAAANGFDGVLVEGWNLGWDGNWINNGDKFDFTTPYPDFDLEAVTAYAAEKGVKLIGHNETSTGIANYEEQMEDAFALYESLGMDTVKTGYVGYGQGIKRRDANGNVVGLEWHHGQYMVEHYQRVVETAARYHIMLDVHEPIKDTGIRRTYPNMMTREGARGQEYNAWGENGGNPLDHTTILPFTRLLAGPMDYTPGVIDFFYEERPQNRINSTLARELALYVVIYSPLQMAADLPENYEGQPAFQFIKDVPADWADTQVPDSAIGDYITTVRKDRASDDWYLGSITDEEARTLEVKLDFLDTGRSYTATIYRDGAGADWESNPYAMEITTMTVDSTMTLELVLAAGGGQAIRFQPAD